MVIDHRYYKSHRYILNTSVKHHYSLSGLRGICKSGISDKQALDEYLEEKYRVRFFLNMELRFITKKINTLADSELEKCSELYSRCYSKYSGSDKPSKKGERIKMGVSLYKKLYYSNSSIYISLCYKEEKLLGHAIFLIKQVEGKGKCSWVLQLVVDSKYRGQKIGSRLLFSAWGFSDFYAWGLATANAITLKTLETATWRQISISDITDNISVLEQLMDDVPFVEKKQFV